MPYIDLAGLSRYASRQKERLERDYALLRDMQWTRSEKAGAVSLWPVGGTPLKPVVDFLFTEVPPAEGDKGPSNPSTITGVSSVNLWLAGKNVNRTMPYYNFTDGEKVNHDVTFTANSDGSITANGTATDGDAICSLLNTNNVSAYGTPIGVGTWRLSGCPSGGSNSTYAIQPILSGGYGTISYDYGSGGSVIVTKPGAMVGVILRVGSGYNAQNLVFRPQIELGTVATVYGQPVEKQKYTIPLGSTYYGGTLDVATGVMTVTWWGYVFNGTENWLDSSTHGTYYRYSLPIKPNKNTTDIACTHFIRVNNLDYEVQHYIIFSSGISIFTTQTTVEDFKTWLASQYAGGTPVVACYALATPQTVQLTPTEILSLVQADKYTPRLNTIYTDAQAVQVGYVKSPIRDEYELQQAVIAQGGNV